MTDELRSTYEGAMDKLGLDRDRIGTYNVTETLHQGRCPILIPHEPRKVRGPVRRP